MNLHTRTGKCLQLLSFILAPQLISCTSEDINTKTTTTPDDIMFESMSGTWQVEQVQTVIDIGSNTEVAQTTTHSTVFFEEDADVINFYTCFMYIDSRPAEKLVDTNGELQFVSLSLPAFTVIQKNKLLSRSWEETMASFKFVNQVFYTKKDNSIPVDAGKLQLDGPVTASEDSIVCTTQSIEQGLITPSIEYHYLIEIPYQNDVLRLSIDTTEPLKVDSYQYDAFTAATNPVVYGFSISSNADIFQTIVGSNSLWINLADFSITSVQTDLVEGNFSFTDQPGNDYSGNFSFTPYLTN